MINFTCSSFTRSKSTFKNYVAVLGLMVTFLAFSQSPNNGGFEDGTTGWTTAGSASTTNARTGANSLSHTTSSNSNVAHTNASTISIANNRYGIAIGWARGSNTSANASIGGTLNTTTSSTATTNIQTTLTRLTYATALNNSGSAQNFSCRVNTRSLTSGVSTTLYWDDIITYSSTTATPDLTKPTSASAFTSGSITSNSISFSWTNGTDAATGIQNTIILRTTNLSASTPVMNDQGVYSVAGGTSGPNVVSTDWSVMSVSVGSGATSFTDNSVASGTSYKYAVIHRDLAYNYSNALVSGTLSSLSGFTISWCNLQFPTSQTIAEGSTFSVYGQVYAAGLTEAAGQGANLNAWVGYSATNSNPNSGSWTWIPASYNTNVGDNDEFIASLGAGITPGSYFYAYRYQIGSGAYAYGGTGGVWNNDSATLTVNSNLVNWCNIQYPLSGTITQGDVYNVYSKVYDPGITNNTGQGAGISGWIGYSATDSNPNTGSWTWVTASFQGDAGNDDEYFANIATSLAPGTYYYASRYQKTGSTEFRYGGTNGIWNNDSGVLTVNQAIPVISAGSPTGTYNAPFTYSLVATFSPTSYAISSGTLPNGLSLNTTSGVISGTPTQTGVFNVDFTATNNGGTSAPQTITFTINPANQTITFGTLANVPIGTAPFALTATASSGLTVSYESSNTAVATISGNTITIVGVGTADITASQAGDANYNAATNVTRSITVLAVANQIAFVGVPTSGNLGVNLTTFTVEARRPDNSVDTFYNQNITLSQASGTGNISGTLTVQAVNGVATFSTIQFDAVSTYTLHANSGTFDQITSGNIVVTLVPVSIFANTIVGTNPSTSNPFTSGQTFNANITVSGIGRGNGIAGTAAGDRYAANSWTSTASTTIVSDEYFEFVLTPNLGYKIDFNTLVFTHQRSASGPSTFAVRSSVDSFATDLAIYSNTGTNTPITETLSLSSATFDEISNAITFRVYGYNSGTGVGSINDFIFNGNVLCIQPTAFNVTGGGAVCVGGSGTLVGLSGSQTGISYQLKLNGNDVGSPVAGTGAALSFGSQAALGTYTVVAINSACSLTVTMNGNAVIATGTTTWSGSPTPSWDNGAPTSGVTAIISANYSEAENIDACALVVNNGAVVSIPAGNVVSLFGGITVETGSSFVLESNAVLLQGGTTNQNTGAITVKRNSQDLMRLDYTLWSSPVENQNLLAFSPLTMANRFYTYNTTTDAYSAITPSTNSFTNGQGYLIRMPDNHPTSPTAWNGAFIGKPNSGTITIGLSTAGTGYNAVGNPYPSPITISTFLAENNGVIGSDLYFWRKTNAAAGSAYVTFSGGVFSDGPHANNTIQPGQGFIVQATSATDLTFTNTQRNANNGVFYRNENATESEDSSRIWLNLKSNEVIVGQMAIGYRAEATNSIDANFDAAYFNDSALALNSIVDGSELAVQHRAPFTVADIVPLSFKTTTAGTYVIAINEVDGLFTNAAQNIYLKDNLLNVEHDLRTAPYSFSSESGVFSNRFEIVYQSALSVETPTFGNGVVVFSKNKTIEINFGNEPMSSVKVFDVRGSLIAEKLAVNNTNTSIDLTSIANQVLIIQITAENGQFVSRKVVH